MTMALDIGSNDNDSNMHTITANNNHHQRDIVVYIVQRSWYAGPQTTPPVDYRRLLLSRTAADQVAYHSAHQWAEKSMSLPEGGGGSTVRTLQLPDGSFGFLAANHLFWVRSVTAQATVDLVGTNHTQQQEQQFHDAHCILSPDGTLLGGTQSRRAALTTEQHCIFVGPQSSHAALQWLMTGQQLQQQQRTMQWVPVGPPPTPHHIAVEWPETKNTHGTKLNRTTPTTSSKRRCADELDGNTTNHTDNTAACLWFGSDSNYQRASCKRQSGQMRRPISFVDGEVEDPSTPVMSNNNNNAAGGSNNNSNGMMMMLE